MGRGPKGRWQCCCLGGGWCALGQAPEPAGPTGVSTASARRAGITCRKWNTGASLRAQGGEVAIQDRRGPGTSGLSISSPVGPRCGQYSGTWCSCGAGKTRDGVCAGGRLGGVGALREGPICVSDGDWDGRAWGQVRAVPQGPESVDPCGLCPPPQDSSCTLQHPVLPSPASLGESGLLRERPHGLKSLWCLLAVIPSRENKHSGPRHAGGGAGARTDGQRTPMVYTKRGCWAPHTLGTGCRVSTRQRFVCSELAF